MTDSNVPIKGVGSPDSTSGQRIDTTQLTRADGVVVDRQRVALADDLVHGATVKVSPSRELSIEAEIFQELLLEMRLTRKILELAFKIRLSPKDLVGR